MRTTLTSLLGVAVLLSAQAFAADYTDGKGISYSSVANAHGVTLKSSHATIFLGNACDASSPQFGKGTWSWANGGFLVQFGQMSIGFPRQELHIDNQGGCQM
jgi:hypothetical protein